MQSGPELLQSLATRALEEPDVDALLSWTTRTVADALGAATCAIYEAEAEGLVQRNASGPDDGDDISEAAEAAEAAVKAGRAHFLDALPTGYAQGAAAVLPGGGLTEGAVVVLSRTPDAFDASTLIILQGIANVLAGALVRQRAAAALQRSEALAHAVLETTVDAIITIDARAVVQSFNRAAERIFGYTAAQVIGRNVSMLMPEPYHSEHDTYISNYHETRHRKIIGIGREVTGRRADGSVFPMYLAVSEVPVGARRLFTGIVRDITERRRLEQEVLRVSEDERRRIGQDLHDGLGQMLTGLGLISTNVARRLEQEGHRAAEDVGEVADLVKEADAYARQLARGLVPVEVEQGGLTGAMQRLVYNAERLLGTTCTYRERVLVPVEDTAVAMHLYRIAQEAVSNAVRHGKSRRVDITLDAGVHALRLRIQDDGVGIDGLDLDAPPEALEVRRGMGVRIMHYRARIIGAELDIAPREGGGTTVTCILRRALTAHQPDPRDGHPIH